MPCFDPVLMITDGFSWASMFGTNACCTFSTLARRARECASGLCDWAQTWHSPEEVHIKNLVPVVKTFPRFSRETDASVVHENCNLCRN